MKRIKKEDKITEKEALIWFLLKLRWPYRKISEVVRVSKSRIGQLSKGFADVDEWGMLDIFTRYRRKYNALNKRLYCTFESKIPQDIDVFKIISDKEELKKWQIKKHIERHAVLDPTTEL